MRFHLTAEYEAEWIPGSRFRAPRNDDERKRRARGRDTRIRL